jgi:hypothetical protein
VATFFTEKRIEAIKQSLSYWKDDLGNLQIQVYTMCGGGTLGRFAAEQPADFYIDGRVVRLPFKKRDIEKSVRVLAILAEAAGLNPHDMPKMPHMHGFMGVF